VDKWIFGTSNIANHGALAAGIGGFIKTLGDKVLQSYDPKTNKWDIEGVPIITAALVEGGLGSYLGKAAADARWLARTQRFVRAGSLVGAGGSLLRFGIPKAVGPLISSGWESILKDL
jgi:hypothetical protein